jgi:hypothetical protein
MKVEKFKTKDLTLIAVFSAVWIAYTFFSNMVVGQIVHGIDVHVVRSVLLVLIVALMGRFGGATWMTVIVGLFYLSSRTPYPSVIITAATIGSGLVYDIYTKLTGYQNCTSIKFMPVGVVLAGLTQSVMTLGLVTLIGFFPPMALEGIWITGLTRNVIASVVGIVIALAIAKRVVNIYSKSF